MTNSGRDVSLGEMVAVNHTIRVYRNALMTQRSFLIDIFRSKNHRALGQFDHAEAELLRMAVEVEGQAIRVYGLEAWDRARLLHWEFCSLTEGSGRSMPLCVSMGGQ